MTKCKSTKRALLSSILAMVLCVAMLVGTTFAWFTDRVTSGANQIVAGNLDVELYHGANLDETVNGATDLFMNADGTAIAWEPGAIAYENFRVVNAGSLALKYQLSTNITGYNTVDGKSLADVLKVAVLEGETFSGDRAAAQALTFDSTLSDVVKEGNLTAGAEDTYAVVIYWEPGANDNDYNLNNGKTSSDGNPLFIDLGITLVAAQDTVESDSFDSDYDANAPYATITSSDESSLRDALTSSDVATEITVPENISGVRDALNVTGEVTLNMGSSMIYNITSAAGTPISVADGGSLTINAEAQRGINYTAGKLTATGADSSLTVNGGSYGYSGANGAEVIAENGAVITLNEGSFSTSGAGGSAVKATDGSTIYINGGSYSSSGAGSTVMLADGGTIIVNDCDSIIANGSRFGAANGGEVRISKTYSPSQPTSIASGTVTDGGDYWVVSAQ